MTSPYKRRIHLAGLGRVGSATIDALIRAGFRYFSGNDPQTVDHEAAEAILSYAAHHDKTKAEATRLRLKAYPGVTFTGVSAPNESPLVDPFINAADIVICGANTVAGRRAAAEKAIAANNPLVDVSLADAREGIGGFVKVWLPENAEWSACPACWLTDAEEPPRGELLLGSVAGYVGAIVAQLITQYVFDLDAAVVRRHSFFVVDAAAHHIERYAVAKDPACTVCGKQDDATSSVEQDGGNDVPR